LPLQFLETRLAIEQITLPRLRQPHGDLLPQLGQGGLVR
jgi:hypothetical protein